MDAQHKAAANAHGDNRVRQRRKDAGQARPHLKRIRKGEIAHPLIEQLIDLIDRDPRSVQQIAKRAEISKSAIFHWLNGQRPRVDSFSDVANALGYRVELVKIEVMP